MNTADNLFPRKHVDWLFNAKKKLELWSAKLELLTKNLNALVSLSHPDFWVSVSQLVDEDHVNSSTAFVEQSETDFPYEYRIIWGHIFNTQVKVDTTRNDFWYKAWDIVTDLDSKSDLYKKSILIDWYSYDTHLYEYIMWWRVITPEWNLFSQNYYITREDYLSLKLIRKWWSYYPNTDYNFTLDQDDSIDRSNDQFKKSPTLKKSIVDDLFRNTKNSLDLNQNIECEHLAEITLEHSFNRIIWAIFSTELTDTVKRINWIFRIKNYKEIISRLQNEDNLDALIAFEQNFFWQLENHIHWTYWKSEIKLIKNEIVINRELFDVEAGIEQCN